MLKEGPGLAVDDSAAARDRLPLPDRLRRHARAAFATVFETGRSQRFLALPMLVAIGVYLILFVTFASFSVANDGTLYYDFLRRFLGEDVAARAYQFGSAYFDLPFYAVARAADAVSGPHTVFGAPLREASIAVASTAALLLTFYLGWKILVELELPAGPGVLLLTLFGTPLFYYTLFQPAYKHAVDALAMTLLAYLMLLVSIRATTRHVLGLGACLAYLLTVRYANFAILPGALLPLVLARDFRRLRLAVAAMAVVGGILFALPAARHIPYREPGSSFIASPLVQPAPAHRMVEAGLVADFTGLCPDERYYHINFWQCLHNRFGLNFRPAAPVQMLFTLRRGLFLWTPLTAFATLGVILLFRARPERRRFLIGLCTAALCLLLIHIAWGEFWTNGFSFSQRFLSSLFPFFLIGTAQIVRRFRGAAVAVLSLCALFAVFIGFYQQVGYRGISDRDGVDTILALYTNGQRTPQGLVRTIAVHAADRWGLHDSHASP
jgi:hypothetical protein